MLSAYFVGSIYDASGHHGWGADDKFFWLNLAMSPVIIVIGLPFYGYWADLHLWHIAMWIASCVVFAGSSSRGLRISDSALIAAAVVLAFPFMVDADSPNVTWEYPDAFFMAAATACGAAICTALVRGVGRVGIERRLRWEWLTKEDILQTVATPAQTPAE